MSYLNLLNLPKIISNLLSLLCIWAIWSKYNEHLSVYYLSKNKVGDAQCDQIWQFFGIWATF